jgi:hypothetical protein
VVNQALNPLKEAGAGFGPDDKTSFISTLNLRKAERFLGVLKVTSLQFKHPPSKHVGRFATTALEWTEQADASFSNRSRAQYGLSFEPFEGNLTFLTQVGWDLRIPQSPEPKSQ